MFAYPCPACHQRLLAPSERAGQRTICPKCLKPLTVPEPPAAVSGDSVTNSEAVLSIPRLPFETRSHGITETPVPMNTASPYEAEALVAERQAAQVEQGAVLATAAVGAESSYANPFAESPTGSHYQMALLQSAPPLPLHLVDPEPCHDIVTPTARPNQATPAPNYTTRRAVNKERAGRVQHETAGLFNLDAVAELSAAISMRMAPPPIPATDRGVVLLALFAGWGLGLMAWLLGVWANESWFPFVTLIGGAMVVLGLIWRANLSSRHGSWIAGVLTFLPPICLVQLLRPFGQHGRRPLWFVLAGASLCGMAYAGPDVKARIDAAIGPKSPETFKVKAATTQGQAKLEQWTSAERAQAATAVERSETIADIKAYLNSTDSETRRLAWDALVLWSPERAKITALESLADKGQRDVAKATLIKLGRDAEADVIKLLQSSSDSTTLSACEVIEQIGSEQSVAALRQLADASTTTRAVRLEALSTAEAISKRLSKN